MLQAARAMCLSTQADFVHAGIANQVFDSIAPLEAVYPGFDAWFHCTVVPGLRDGSRKLFVGSAADRVAGVAIAKRTSSEQKLCTLWIAPGKRNEGLAKCLANEAFDWLGTTMPLFTVPDVRIAEFARLLDQWHFVQTQVVENMYRPASREFVFNGFLRAVS